MRPDHADRTAFASDDADLTFPDLPRLGHHRAAGDTRRTTP